MQCAVFYGISVVVTLPQILYVVSLAGTIVTDAGCAGCRRVEKTHAVFIVMKYPDTDAPSKV